jgi:haloalkane dehalogenase
VDVLRTPDDRFAALPDFPYAPRYVDLSGVRVHHIDEGPRDAPVVLLLHGEPTWAFLWRRVIAGLVRARLRVVAIDLVGFGRSDKPARREDHTYARHVAWTRGAIEAIGLRDVTLVGHDWGGLIGLRLVAEHGHLFSRVVATNTGLPTGEVPMPAAFAAWQQASQRVPELLAGRVVQGGALTSLPDEVIAAYDAPFPDEPYKAGPRQMPLLVPTAFDDPGAVANRAAWQRLREWRKPFLCAFSDGDPITRGADLLFQDAVPGCADLDHPTIRGAAHFLQEDRGDELGAVIAEFVHRFARP